MMNNSEPKMSSYLHSLAIKKGIPVSGSFELTPNCNFSCPMCYVHSARPCGEELTAKQWLLLAEEAKAAGMMFLLLTGGEPFIKKDFEQIYTGLSKMGFVISINTNGSLVTENAELLKKYPPSRVNVSLYAADRQAYKDFCGVDKFDSVVNGIEFLKKEGIGVRLNSVFTAKNHMYAPQIIDFAKEHDLHLKSTSYCYPQIRVGGSVGLNSARLDADLAAQCEVDAEYRKFGDAYAAKALGLQREMGDGDAREYRRVRCRAGRCSFWLTWNGKMRPCGMMTRPEADPFKSGFAAAWNEILKMTAEIRLPLECSVCKRREACPVCAAMCLSETGRFDGKPQYVCDYFECVRSLSSEKLEEIKCKIGDLPTLAEKGDDLCEY